MKKALLLTPVALIWLAAAAAAQAPAQYETLLSPVLSGNQTVIGQTIAYPPGTPGLTAVIVTVPPGGSTGWHQHPVPLFAYLLEGELTVDYGSRGTRIYRAGEGLIEAVDWPHNGTNLGSGTVRILAVYLGTEGIPNTESAAGPR